MPLETAGFHDTAVVWEATSLTKQGRVVVSNRPVEIPCTWDYITRRLQDEKGDPVNIDARVAVEDNIPDGSAMWKGELSDLASDGSPPSGDVMVVTGRQVTGNVNGTHSRFVMLLTKQGESLPEMEDPDE